MSHELQYEDNFSLGLYNQKPTTILIPSMLAQGKSAGLITRRSLDRNQDMLFVFFFPLPSVVHYYPIFFANIFLDSLIKVKAGGSVGIYALRNRL